MSVAVTDGGVPLLITVVERSRRRRVAQHREGRGEHVPADGGRGASTTNTITMDV